MRTVLIFIKFVCIVMILKSGLAYATTRETSFDHLKNYKFVENIPERSAQNILIISNRHFIPELGYDCFEEVHPDNEIFYFIASRLTDSSFITRYNSLEEALLTFDHESKFLLFVNGHKKTFEQTIVRGFEIGDRYEVNMIMFDWPTEYHAVRKTISNARKVTDNFVSAVKELNSMLSNNYPEASISVIFHSMGNRILKNVVKKDFLNELPNNIFENIILNAAAVSHRGHAKWVDKLDIQENIYITLNDGDFPLRGLQLLRFSKQLGTGYKGQRSENAIYINFSAIADREHNLFLGRSLVEKNHPNVYSFYYTTFHSDVVNPEKNSEFATKKDNGVYNIL